MQINKIFLALGAALLMVGCGSSVNLDSVPVEERTAAAVDQDNAAKGTVAPVDLSQAGGVIAGPAGVSNVVFFDYDSFAIKVEAQPIIEGHARFLKADRTVKATLAGHTDERGGREYNLALGQKRAEAVRRALVLLGVPDSQVEAVSFGKEKPAAQGADEAAWAKNRRVEFSYQR